MAKEYATENLELSEDTVEIYNNYHFYNNIGSNMLFLVDNYPKAFVRFCYNDANKTLIFLGLYTSGTYLQTANELSGDWEAFLNEFYGHCYDFSA